MADLFRIRGPHLGALIALLTAVWAIALVIAPIAVTAVRSLETVDADVATLRLERELLLGELANLRHAWEAVAEPEGRADLDRRIRLLAERAHRLETLGADGPVTFGFANFARLAGAPVAALVQGLATAAVATLLALLLAYPAACATAGASDRTRGPTLVALLVVPFALGEVLRLHAWRALVGGAPPSVTRSPPRPPPRSSPPLTPSPSAPPCCTSSCRPRSFSSTSPSAASIRERSTWRGASAPPPSAGICASSSPTPCPASASPPLSSSSRPPVRSPPRGS